MTLKERSIEQLRTNKSWSVLEPPWSFQWYRLWVSSLLLEPQLTALGHHSQHYKATKRQSTTTSTISLESLSDKNHTHFNLSNFMVRVFSALRRYFRIVGISFTMVTFLEAGWKVDSSSPCVHRKSSYHVGQTMWHHDDHSLVILHHICNLHELKLVP